MIWSSTDSRSLFENTVVPPVCELSGRNSPVGFVAGKWSGGTGVGIEGRLEGACLLDIVPNGFVPVPLGFVDRLARQYSCDCVSRE
jgi:hypothetical protein